VDLHLYAAKLDSTRYKIGTFGPHSAAARTHPTPIRHAHSTRNELFVAVFRGQRGCNAAQDRRTHVHRLVSSKHFSQTASVTLRSLALPLPLALPPLVETTIRPSTKTPLIRGVTSNGATLVEHARWVYAFWDSPNATLGLISTPAS
jgi:hypothetical protein